MSSDGFGALLRQHRKQRRFSQLDLAGEADISSRHLSFMETGRARPSREMILHLGRVLDMPMKDVNLMLVTAGYAPAYRERALADDDMASAREALNLLMKSHEPFPAVVIDDQWNLLMVNSAQQAFVAYLSERGARFPASSNLMDHFFAPGGYRDFVDGWQEFAVFLLQRIEKEAMLQGAGESCRELIGRLEGYPGVPANWRQQTVSFESTPMLALNVRVADQCLSLFSTIAVFGSPLDVTLQGIRIEHYFPADDKTRDFFMNIGQPDKIWLKYSL